MRSAIYRGKVSHKRFGAKEHQFAYRVFYLALDLDELQAVDKLGPWFKLARFAPLQLRPQDYLDSPERLDKHYVWNQIIKTHPQAQETPQGRVVMVAMLRCFGLFFSPVNFYFAYDEHDQATWMLAEVSNTPWNERHCYVVDLKAPQPSPKEFHVSPFMDLDMDYHWCVRPPSEHLAVDIESVKTNKLFQAKLRLQRYELSNRSLRNQVLSIPSMVLKTLFGIYWQAFKLFFIKRIPYVAHQSSMEKK
ncbi:DUF1365 domain-containing protein [Alginatibacterium sediminis]|uniref:DUF1365 domain-containing protein n=1 Tax=Alginatibacterium sediminis TaxID=2164068 RepID=A0A420E8I5_9ALTE|nr:DUF1365 domain-containing protein [Alginatibacterium sediminis]RKF15711.1 DUF1365 domain-containing protein [Alginatibacterium sediminis]